MKRDLAEVAPPAASGARRSRFVPGPFLAPAIAAIAIVAGVSAVAGASMSWAWLLVAGTLVVAWIESRSLGALLPEVERRPNARLVLGEVNRVVLRLRNRGATVVRGVLRDDPPAGMEVDEDELPITLAPYARLEIGYALTPRARGPASFGDIHVRLDGPLRMGARSFALPRAQAARVYPQATGLGGGSLEARRLALRALGLRMVRRVGGGGELEQLREYVRGDAFRDLDWKATAKRQRPITRVYTQERSQHVMLAVDAGRLMAQKLDDLEKLDQAIRAALLVAYVALREGDRVGVIVFADEVLAFVPPGKGQGQYHRILETLYGVEAQSTYVDFRRLVEFVKVRVPRRSLFVLFSDLLDEAHAAPLAEHLPLLRAKHLPVCVAMRDPVAHEARDKPVRTAREVYRRAAATDLLFERDALTARLRKAGVTVVEARASELAAAAVTHYLTIKARQAL